MSLCCQRAGRKAFFGHGLNLEAAGVKLERGKVITDKDFRTTAKSGRVFAIGDAINGPMLAHKVRAELCHAADQLCSHRTPMLHLIQCSIC